LGRVVAAGGSPKKAAFAGVGKTEREIEFALRRAFIRSNVESEPELERINRAAGRLKKIAPVRAREPECGRGTHAKITTGTYETNSASPSSRSRGFARASRLKNLRLRGLQ